MINKIILIMTAIATVQCQYPATPYARPPCGIPGMPAAPALPTILPIRPPCANTLPISLPVPGLAPPCPNSLPISILNSAYEVPLPSFKTPLELPMSLSAPPKCLKSPYELALPVSLPKYCGCVEAAMPKYDIPLPRNPYLPAASPVSALAPFSPMFPPANTCSRCQYLKKIPIPPPYI